MNAPAKIPAVAARALPPSASGAPATSANAAGGRGQHLTPREYKLIRDVTEAYDALGKLREAVIRSGGKWSTNALRANVAAAKAAKEIWDCDLDIEIDNTEADLPDYPVEAEFNPSLRHPDAEVF